MLNLHIAAEKYAGFPISDEEYQSALLAAQRKLKHINNLYGTRYGEPYLAILIAEEANIQRIVRRFGLSGNPLDAARY